jgi:hypothetical protein
MSSNILMKRFAMAACVASLAAALPATAGAHQGPGGGGARAGAVKLSTRVTDRTARAAKDVDRAGDAIDDGNATTAVSDLTAARTNLASAQKSALKHVVAGDSTGAAYAWAILAADDRVASGSADLFDGQDGAVVDAAAATLKAADDSRDAVIAAINALTDKSGYADVASRAGDDVTDELGDVADALSDDTLTAAATSALTDAQTQVKATQTALTALAGDDSSSGDASYLGSASSGDPSTSGSGSGNCPHGGGQGSQQQGSGSGTGTGSGSYLS